MESFDVAIIGGGIIGGSIAFELAQRKLRVVILERQQPGREASWAAAGMLAPVPDSLESAPLMPLAKASFALYPDFLAAVESLSCLATGFRSEATIHAFFAPHGEAERNELIAELRQVDVKAEAISAADARSAEPALGESVRAAVWLPEEASVEPRLLTEAVLVAAARHGARIRTGVPVTSLLRKGSRVSGVIAGGEKIAAGRVVLAAGCYSGGIEGLERYAPTHPVRGQMVALRSANSTLRHVLRSHRGYVVPRNNGSVVAGSTLENAGFEKHVTPTGLRQILDAAVELAPVLSEAAILETWAGLRPGTPDGLPILGPVDLEGLLIATGHYRNGILLAPITAKLIREWIVEGRTSEAVDKFSPLRFLEARRGAGR
jgi:glycine oxidase